MILKELPTRPAQWDALPSTRLRPGKRRPATGPIRKDGHGMPCPYKTRRLHTKSRFLGYARNNRGAGIENLTWGNYKRGGRIKPRSMQRTTGVSDRR